MGKTPVRTSRSGNIGEHRIVEEIGRIVVRAADVPALVERARERDEEMLASAQKWHSYQKAKSWFDKLFNAESNPVYESFLAHYRRTKEVLEHCKPLFESDVQALEFLKDEARERGANGIIHVSEVQMDRQFQRFIEGIAVRLEPK